MPTQKNTPITSVKALFKEQLPHFKSMLFSRCKTRINTQNANDAMAVAAGYKDYQTAIGIGGTNHYTVRVNLGIKNTPFWVSKPVGQHESEDSARIAAEILTRDCNESLEWLLFKDERKTAITLWSEPHSSGLTLQLSANAESLTDIKEHITEFLNDEQTSRAGGIHYRKNTSFTKGHFKAALSGKNKSNLLDKSPHIETTTNYAVISENGVLGSCYFDNYFDNDGAGVLQQHHGENGLACAHSVDEEEFYNILKNSPDTSFSVFTIASKPEYFSGHGTECLTYMKHKPYNRFNVYQHM
jgi:hypothetical protein